MQPQQDLPVHQEAENSQQASNRQEGQKSRINRGFHFFRITGAQVLRRYYGSSHSSSYGNHNKHVGQRIRSAHRRKSIFSHKLSHNHGIHHIIKLLEQIA